MEMTVELLIVSSQQNHLRSVRKTYFCSAVTDGNNVNKGKGVADIVKHLVVVTPQTIMLALLIKISIIT